VARALEAAVASKALDGERLEEAAARRREVLGRLAEPVTLDQEEIESGRARGAAISREAVRVVRGAVPSGLARVRVAVVDDDAGGPYPLPSRAVFAEALREGGTEVVAQGGDAPLVVLVYCDVKSWKCRAGLSAEHEAEVAALAREAAAVVLFGHPRRLADVPGSCPVLCAFSGDPVMQRAAAARLLSG